MGKRLLVLLVLLLAPASAGAQPSVDDGNAATRLIRDIGSDYKNFVSLDTAEVVGVGGFAAIAAHAADEEVAKSVETSNPSSLAGGNIYGSQLLHVPVAAAYWIIASAAGSSRHAEVGRDLLRAQISVVSWSYAIKYATDRTRPNGDPRSLPSGHSSTSFATATVLQTHYGWKVGLPAFLAATYSGVSRIVDNQHWVSDVVLGAAVGIASGRTATLHVRNTKLSVAPLAVPGGGGVLFSRLGHP